MCPECQSIFQASSPLDLNRRSNLVCFPHARRINCESFNVTIDLKPRHDLFLYAYGMFQVYSCQEALRSVSCLVKRPRCRPTSVNTNLRPYAPL